MNKRLRKKKYIGEFNHFGFSIEGKFGAFCATDRDKRIDLVDQFLDELIEVIEANHLEMGGGVTPTGLSMFVLKHKQGKRDSRGEFKTSSVSCTDEDRQLVEDWLKDQTILHLVEYQVGPLNRSN
jgi:uncharacterized protein YggL (DUF469 family)